MVSAFSFVGPARFAAVPFALDITPPVGGVVVSALNRPAGNIRVTWTAATDINGVWFEVYAQPDTATGLFSVANVAGVFAGTSGDLVSDATGAEFTRGRTYWFGVRPIDRFGNRGTNTTAVSLIANGPDFAALNTLLAAVEQDTRADLPAFIAAGFEALNQSAARRIVFATSAAFEIPAAGSYPFQFQLRTYDPDGNPVNASAVSVTATFGISTDYSARISSLTNPAVGVYVGTFTAQSSDVPGPLRFDASATLGDGVQTLPFFGYITRAVGVDFTQGDRDVLNALATRASEPRLAILDDLPVAVSQQVAADFFDGNFNWDVIGETLVARGIASGEMLTSVNDMVAAIFSDPSWLARFVSEDTGQTEAGPGSVALLSGGASTGGSDHPLATN